IAVIENHEPTGESDGFVRKASDFHLRACRSELPASRQNNFGRACGLRLALRALDITQGVFVWSLLRKLPQLAVQIIFVIRLIGSRQPPLFFLLPRLFILSQREVAE